VASQELQHLSSVPRTPRQLHANGDVLINRLVSGE
jgi:hypothetical protein